ncbi:MAG: VCBS repeat-containing protein [Burkholderiales bacterium]|nr:VCBS repeat-containing protein [Burkholderiales bacterium]
MPALARMFGSLAFAFALCLSASTSAEPVVVTCPVWRSGIGLSGNPTIAAYLGFYDIFKNAPQCLPVSVSGCMINSPHSVQYDCVGYTSGNCSCSQAPCSRAATGGEEMGLIHLGPIGNQTVHCGYYIFDGSPNPPKNNGDPSEKDCKVNCGNPVNTGTGGKYQREVDFAKPYDGGLEFVRHYNSGARGERTAMGANWRHTWLPRIEALLATEVYATRADGVRRTFVAGAGGTWVGQADTPDLLVQTAGGWVLTTRNNEFETYDAAGRILSAVDPAGRITTFSYSDGTAATATIEGAGTALPEGLLIRVTDYRGRSMTFGYNDRGLVVRMTDPQAQDYAYQYSTSGDNLLSVTYPDGRTRAYHYNEPANTGGTSQPNALTGITDENAARFATYKYDSQGRVTRSEHAGGADGFTFSYGVSGASSYVDPLGAARATEHSVILGVAKRTSTTEPCPACGGSVTNLRTFDANGNLASEKDFNGNLTCFSHDPARNLETGRTEGLSAAGTCAARVTTDATRTISTQWHTTWRSRKRVAEPLRITTYFYHGEPGVQCAPAGAATTLLCSKTVQATTDATGASGFGAVADGAPRTWSFTYNADGQLLSLDGPRTDVADVTTNAYHATNDPGGAYRRGDLASITNALGQVTQFTHYDGAGRLVRQVDPNGLETILDYWPRGWIKSRKVGTAATGYEITSYEYDFVGQLKKVTMPDSSFVSYGYDDAHRLVSIADGLGNRIAYALDGAGNRTGEEAFDPGNALVRAHTRVYDILGRMKQDIGGTQPALQVTTSDYDANGNLVSTLDPLGRTTTRFYDTRNRLRQVRDPVNGAASPTQYDYNALDQLTSVTDPMGLATTFAVNGHGEALSQASPDTGVTGFAYDPASNIASRLDARGVTAVYAYDALNRIAQIAYPDETVVYTYDACANGIGRACSVSDKTGTTSWAYDIKGRVIAKTQNVGGLTQTVTYGYNAAGQLDSLVTPSGQVVHYAYENNRPVSVTVNGTKVLDQVFYEPFGPNGGWRWGNSTPLRPNFHSRLHDADFRAESITSDLPLAGGVKAIAKTYAWDGASRIETITDIANSALSATYGYDDLDRLTFAGMGTGTWGYAYNGIGNRLTSTAGTLSTTYTYFPGTHRLQSLGGAKARAYVFDAAGNMTSDGTSTWTYGGNNRPTQAQTGAITTAFDINALGQRVRKTTGAAVTRFVHDEGGRLIGEYAGDGTLRAEYIWLDELPVAVISAQTRQAGVNDDLDGDAVPDLVFRNGQTGDTFAWLLNADRTFRTPAYLGNVGIEWDLAGMKDINGDGHLDAIWRNSVTGGAYVWYFDGLQYAGFDYLFTLDPAFKVAAVADFNGDGRADFVLRERATGMTIVWYFNGTQYLSGEFMFTLDPGWQIGGAADVNGDGKTDFLVSELASGNAGVWYMNGAQYQSGEYIGTMSPGWQLVHVADFNGDLGADAVIREASSGVAFLEFLSGAQVSGEEWFFNVDPVWQLGPAGEQFQKGVASPAPPLVNRPLPPGFARPSFGRRAGASIPAARRPPDVGRIPTPADHRGPVPPGPTPPAGKHVAKSMVGGTPAALYYVTPDHLGTPRVITRPTDNAIVWRWDNTEPFGDSPPTANPSGVGDFAFNLRFPGQYFDAETGTHYNMARDYDPGIGRYIQSDPMDVGEHVGARLQVPLEAAARQSRFQPPVTAIDPGVLGVPLELNSYAYVANSPLRWTDFTGESIGGFGGFGRPGFGGGQCAVDPKKEKNCAALRDNIINQTCKSIRNPRKKMACFAAAWATYLVCLAED